MAEGHGQRDYGLKKPKLPKLPKGRQPVPTEAVIDRYLAAIPEELRGLFLARSRDGLRPAEARPMSVRNYDWTTGHLTIYRDDTKTDEGVGVFRLDPELREWLDTWVPIEQRFDPWRPLFINPKCWKPSSLARQRKRGKPTTGRWTPTAEKSVARRRLQGDRRLLRSERLRPARGGDPHASEVGRAHRPPQSEGGPGQASAHRQRDHRDLHPHEGDRRRR